MIREAMNGRIATMPRKSAPTNVIRVSTRVQVDRRVLARAGRQE